MTSILRFLILVLLLQNAFGEVLAQTPINLTASDINNLLLKEIEHDALNDTKNELINVDGSIYLFDDFKKGQVITNGGTFDDVSVRYDIRDEVFQVKMGARILLLDPNASLKRITVDQKVFVVRTFKFQAEVKTGFLEQVVDGTYSLYAKKNLTFRPAKPPKALESEPTRAKYTRPSDTYYLGLPDGSLEKVKNGKDVLFLALSPQLKAKAKDAKISLKKTSHLSKLVALMNGKEL